MAAAGVAFRARHTLTRTHDRFVATTGRCRRQRSALPGCAHGGLTRAADHLLERDDELVGNLAWFTETKGEFTEGFRFPGRTSC